jgi:pyridoxal phosphate enzyme (YggS family)
LEDFPIEWYLSCFAVLYSFAIILNIRLEIQVADRVREVRQRIETAAAKSGRLGSDVRLVAVSKYAAVGDGMVEALIGAGCFDLGESRPQLLIDKAEFYADSPIHWHLIGSLQRNKARKVLPVTTLVHSLDTVKLAEAIDRIAGEEQLLPIHCLLEVAVSGDLNKHGFVPVSIPATLDELGKFRNIQIVGLMCMAGLESDESQTRREFESVRLLAELLQKNGTPPNVQITELSMGMSGDFEIAVEEGATLVRIGSLLYPER